MFTIINILFTTFAPIKLIVMAQLGADKVLKVELITVGDFAKSQGISATAAYSAIRANLVDSFIIGKKVFICNTNLTRQYKPNESPRRKKIVKSKTKKKHPKVPIVEDERASMLRRMTSKKK